MRCLENGEAVSLDGTHLGVLHYSTPDLARPGKLTSCSCSCHLGHNLPDRTGNRYCINLVSVAGSPEADAPAETVFTSEGEGK